MLAMLVTMIIMKNSRHLKTYMCSSGVQPGGMINKPGESVFYFILPSISGTGNTTQFSFHENSKVVKYM